MKAFDLVKYLSKHTGKPITLNRITIATRLSTSQVRAQWPGDYMPPPRMAMESFTVTQKPKKEKTNVKSKG